VIKVNKRINVQVNFLIAGSVLTSLIVWRGVFPEFELPKLIILTMCGSILLFFSIFNYLSGKQAFKKEIVFFLSLYLVCLTITAITTNQNWNVVLLGAGGRYTGFLAQLCYLSIFYYVIGIRDYLLIKRIFHTFVFTGLLFTTYGLLQAFNLDPITWNYNNSILVTLGNTNFSSAFLALNATSTLYILIENFKNYLKSILSGILLLAQIYLIIKINDNQGIILLLIGIFLLLSIFIYSNKKLPKVIKRFWSLQAILIFLGTVISNFFQSGPLHYILNISSFVDRIYHWKTGWEIFKDNTLIGVGLDSFGEYYPLYRTQEIIDFRALGYEMYSFNPHNSIIQAAVSGGIVLLIGYISLLSFIFYRGIRVLQRSSDHFFVGTIFTVWFLYQLQTLISVDSIGLSIWGWIFSGALIALSYSVEESQNNEVKAHKLKPLQRIILSIFIFLCIITNIYSINYLKTNYEYKNLTNYFKNPKSAQLYKSKLDSELLNLNSKIFQVEIREISLNLLATQNRLDLALQVAKEITFDFPRRVNGWDATAKIYEFKNDFVSAKPYRLKTIELDPLNKNFKSKLKN
jgi:O-antigen ligase